MKKYMAGIIIIAVLAMAMIGAWYFTNHPATYSEMPEPVTVGITPNMVPALILVADELDFFSENGLNVTLKSYDSSPPGINDVESGKIDIMMTSEYSTLSEAFEKENISIVSTIEKYWIVFLVARKDHGIKDVSDLDGKKIGVLRGAIVEFYLGRFLDLHGLNIRNVTLVNAGPPGHIEAIVNGSIDATMGNIVNLDQISARLGNNSITWPAQSSQPGYVVLVGRNEWIASHPDGVEKLLRALGQAEEYIVAHPAEAKAIVQKRLNYTDAYMDEIWQYYQFTLSLDRSLITVMNDEGQWMINNNLTNATTLPDFYNYVYTKGLKEVKPEAMNII
jgi:ABC-type nitrate/sulfonate/bicarbonate transport system substrate-binding protein